MTPPTAPERCPTCDREGRQRTPAEIVAGSALHWSHMTEAELRTEHEILRRALETAYAQISLWSPIVARRHEAERTASRWAKVAPLIERLRAECGEPPFRGRIPNLIACVEAILAATEATP